MEDDLSSMLSGSFRPRARALRSLRVRARLLITSYAARQGFIITYALLYSCYKPALLSPFYTFLLSSCLIFFQAGPIFSCLVSSLPFFHALFPSFFVAGAAGARLRHSFPFLSASEIVRLAAGSSHSFQKHLLPMVFGSFCGRASPEITAGVR